MVDILRRYSNRGDLLDDLERALADLERARKSPGQRQSVQSVQDNKQRLTLQDRLSERDIQDMIAAFYAGTSKSKIAEHYNTSESAVKRLLRQHGVRRTSWADRRPG